MTDNPITPPDELKQQWFNEAPHQDYCSATGYVIDKASQWGYEQRGAANEAELQKARDEELEACCDWFRASSYGLEDHVSDKLRAARRPKPLSLSESALDLIDKIEYNAMTKNAGNEKAWDLKELEVVRRALKRLQKLEGQGDG